MSNTAPRHYLIVNAFGRSNRGDSVLLDQCIAEIRAVDPDARISAAAFEGLDAVRAIHPGVDWSERIGNSAIRGPLGRLLSLAYLALAWAATVPGFDWASRFLSAEQRRTVAAYRSADVVISAPGGYIHDTNLAYVIALFHIMMGTRVGARVILAPQSVGPLSSPIARKMARAVLVHCDALCVREGYSYDFLANELDLPRDRIIETGDSAFWDDHVDTDAEGVATALAEIGVSPGEAFIGATVVDWTFPNLPEQTRLRQRYFEGMAQVIRNLHARFGLRTVLFNQVSSDLDAVREVARMAGDAALVNEVNHEPPILRAMIGRSECFIGTRFHSCIFAMMAFRPVVAISYLPKTAYIMEKLGLESDVVEINEFDAGRAEQLAIAKLDDRSGASARVRLAVEHYRATQPQLREVLLRARRP
ncbi:polysaccharide pyruvyl transferase family protein [Novosphingobium sp. KCTC 2891]|uniref:polysaccharide pyruvyl transferase family protein n=1 Tax=Novosphingobium sp. KCTC 2891 TaxID=2989730 RepID=UPI0022225B7F|nr:polysaccharide pyruvyl transferase family protein [Novosphingobium sp. KCTC 2891]MCW1383261.1 polysaccharide pyruvyl transferase family protein [Novosphingobium sp. KCTC 2891]